MPPMGKSCARGLWSPSHVGTCWASPWWEEHIEKSPPTPGPTAAMGRSPQPQDTAPSKAQLGWDKVPPGETDPAQPPTSSLSLSPIPPSPVPGLQVQIQPEHLLLRAAASAAQSSAATTRGDNRAAPGATSIPGTTSIPQAGTHSPTARERGSRACTHPGVLRMEVQPGRKSC